MKPLFQLLLPWLASLSVLCLAGCIPMPGNVRPSAPPPRQPGPLSSAQAALQAGNTERANKALQGVSPSSLNPAQQARYAVLRARMALMQGKPKVALQALPSQPSDPNTAPSMFKLRARALFALGQPVAATQALVQRAPLLHSKKALKSNQNLIWKGLTHAQLGEAQFGHLSGASQRVRGWIQLAVMVRNGADMQNLMAWQAQYPNHPAAKRLPDLLLSAGKGPAPINQQAAFSLPEAGQGGTALLLPLSGNLVQAADAIRNGVQAALSQGGKLAPRTYDTNTESSASAALSQALDNGAGLIIGPLQKPAVSQVNENGPFQVPVIALNYLGKNEQPSSGLLQFGLSPDDEARQTVTNASSQDLHRAIALVPQGARGTSILDAFQKRLQRSGGHLVASAQYPEGTTDFSDIVQQLLDIDASKARDKAVANAIGQWPKFKPRRRQDVDYIFISGTRTTDRMIVTTFRYWRAALLPVYATSEVSDSSGSHDLAGVRFCAAPWKLEPGRSWDGIRNELAQAVDGNTNLEPLYAMGMDAGRLAIALRNGGLGPGEALSGYTGTLSINQQGLVERRLACAKVTQDGLQMLAGHSFSVPGPVNVSVHAVPTSPMPTQPLSSASTPVPVSATSTTDSHSSNSFPGGFRPSPPLPDNRPPPNPNGDFN